ncbi:type IV pilus assembly protein FimV [Deefgea chitinilytica]|uniref:type IV pilus assembly protein FimV n=1 Tax=Deefgea chitinilytica TaxID=570276 RepID=UPI00402BCB98
MLGEIRVHSALGERFDASIPVAATNDEDINSNCFRLVSPHDNAEINSLRRAKLTFQHDGDGGRLLINGFDTQQEPVVNVSVRVKCPGEEDRVFQRDYRVLLDPREYIASQGRRPSDIMAGSNKQNRRNLPRLGTAWLTEEGDSVASIARRYYPNDEKLRARLIEAIYDLNPDLPQGTSVRLGGDWRLQLPPPLSSPAVVSQPARVQAMTPQEAQPRLTLDAVPSASELPRASLTQPNGEFRLRLSVPSLDLNQKNSLSPEETLRLRERLLSLESDEQASQMLQLKYQIAQLEKQLESFKASAVEASPLRVENQRQASSYFSLSWLYVVALIIVVVALVLWRRYVLQRQAQEEPYSMLGISTMHVNPYGSAPTPRSSTNFHSQFMPRTGGFVDDEVAIPVRNIDDQEWHDEDVDVFSPNSVAEEAQLLIDHGLTKQAINLLMHEVAERPTSLALWMKLFDVFQQNNMVELFQERAVAFRLQFSSETLWQQVQALGLQIDPSNPLYQSLDVMSDLASVSETAQVEIVERNLSAGLYNAAGFELHDGGAESHDVQAKQDLEFEIDFSPLQEQALDADNSEQVFIASIPDSFELSEEVASISQSLKSESPLDREVQSMSRPVIQEGDFVSDDEVLKNIAQLICNGQRREAFEHLEVLLYKGTMPQRLTASKWLDKLLSKYGKL